MCVYAHTFTDHVQKHSIPGMFVFIKDKQLSLACWDPGYGPRSQQERTGRAKPLVLYLQSQSFPYVCPFQLFVILPQAAHGLGGARVCVVLKAN